MYKTEYSINSNYDTNKSTFLSVCTKKQETIIETFIDLFYPKNIEIDHVYFSLYRYDKHDKFELTINVVYIYPPTATNKTTLHVENTLKISVNRCSLTQYMMSRNDIELVSRHDSILFLNPFGCPSVAILKKLFTLM